MSDYEEHGYGPEEGDDLTFVDVDLLVRDEGTVVVFAGWDAWGEVTIAVDHRFAEELHRRIQETDEAVTVAVEPWQILHRSPQL